MVSAGGTLFHASILKCFKDFIPDTSKNNVYGFITFSQKYSKQYTYVYSPLKEKQVHMLDPIDIKEEIMSENDKPDFLELDPETPTGTPIKNLPFSPSQVSGT